MEKPDSGDVNGNSDLGGAKQSPLTASMARSSAIFMCSASTDTVMLAGKIGAGKTMHITMLGTP